MEQKEEPGKSLTSGRSGTRPGMLPRNKIDCLKFFNTPSRLSLPRIKNQTFLIHIGSDVWHLCLADLHKFK